MIVLPQITITDAKLISSTVAEPGPGEVAWVTGTAYVVNNECIRATTHRKYLCKNNVTSATPPESDPLNWDDIGPTNKYAMFDLFRDTATVVASPLTVELELGERAGGIGIVGLRANAVRIKVDVGATNFYDRTVNTVIREVTNWLEYITAEFAYRSNVVYFDIPPIANARITITITGGTVECGGLILGVPVNAGKTLAGATSDGMNFSVIERDKFGGISTLMPRASVPITEQRLLINSSQVNSMLALRKRLNAVPALWSGLDDKYTDDYFDAMLIVGIYKLFQIPLDPGNERTVINLKLEEI